MGNQHDLFLLYALTTQADQHRALINTPACTSGANQEVIPMWNSYFNGILVAFGLIMAIGAQNAFVLAQSLRREHHLSVAALCVICDALLVTLGVFGLATVLMQSPVLLGIARWGGAVFLLVYGSQALLRALRPQALSQATESGPRSRRAVLLSALAVTLLNPHVYLDTVLLIGSLGAQQAAPGAYALGAASASLMWFFTLALGAAWLAPWLARPATWRILDLAVAAMMFSVASQLILAN
jgi:L-lysine exporter family protein LysE/ArgO